jgi:hypothetical protein
MDRVEYVYKQQDERMTAAAFLPWHTEVEEPINAYIDLK